MPTRDNTAPRVTTVEPGELADLTLESPRLVELAAAIVARYPEGRSRSGLLPMLHLVQAVEGYVSPAGVAFCAAQLGLTKAEVAAVSTFYTMYKRRPAGEYLISVCTNTMCGVLGGDRAYQALSEHLGVGHDETTEPITADGPSITLEHAECLAACDYAPVMTVNYEFFDQVDADSAVDVAKRLQSGERPMPTRGSRLCSFRAISLQLAGFDDPRPGAADEGRAGEPTLAGNRLAEERRVSVPGFDPDTPIGRPREGTPSSRSAASSSTPPSTSPPSTAPPSTAPPPAADRKPAGDAPPTDPRVDATGTAKAKEGTRDGA